MPITQSRLLSVLKAGLFLREQLSAVRNMAAQQSLALKFSQTTAAEALDQLSLFIQTLPNPEALAVLDREQIRYQLTHKRNDRLRRYMATRRGPARALPGVDEPSGPSGTGTWSPNPVDPTGRSAAEVAAEVDAMDDLAEPLDADELFLPGATGEAPDQFPPPAPLTPPDPFADINLDYEYNPSTHWGLRRDYDCWVAALTQQGIPVARLTTWAQARARYPGAPLYTEKDAREAR